MGLYTAREAEFEEWRQAMLQWKQDCERHFDLRDQFAAAALTGIVRTLPAGSIYYSDVVARQAYGLADDMLRERSRTVQAEGKTNTSISPDERNALLEMAAYFDTRAELRMQAWGSLLRVLAMRSK